MGFYIRKSIKAGPFRFNLSKSGIGVSAGIPGFRVGTGPRGNYIHMGRGGFYYRQSLQNPNSGAASPIANANNPQPIYTVRDEGHDGFVEIESASITNMRNTSSDEILKEFDSKQKKLKTLPFVICATLAIAYFLPANTQSSTYLTLFAVSIALAFISWNFDLARKSVVLFYNLEPEFEDAFTKIHAAFSNLGTAAKSWHIESKANVTDWKRHAGAGQLIKRKQVTLTLKDAPFVKTNIPIPAIPVGKQTIFFFPDRILVFEKNSVGAVSYNDLKVIVSQSQFIEQEGVPSDARVVDHTWRFVNKSGGPDRRFNNNSQIPICLYEYIHFSSTSGLNELLSFSKLHIGRDFEASLTQLARLLAIKNP